MRSESENTALIFSLLPYADASPVRQATGRGRMYAASFPLLICGTCSLILVHCVPVNYLILCYMILHSLNLQERVVKDEFAEGMTLLGRPLKEKWKTARSASSLSKCLLLLPQGNASTEGNNKSFKKLNFSFWVRGSRRKLQTKHYIPRRSPVVFLKSQFF